MYIVNDNFYVEVRKYSLTCYLFLGQGIALVKLFVNTLVRSELPYSTCLCITLDGSDCGGPGLLCAGSGPDRRCSG